MQIDWIQVINTMVTVTIPLGGALLHSYRRISERLAKQEVELQLVQNELKHLGDIQAKVMNLAERLAVLEALRE